ncbi:MAG: hypothetical protein JXD21_07255 [Candidatus Omnitrophica bacterium]|nr:hypothetical protein [Candidatus Omnitrophota bacterium]
MKSLFVLILMCGVMCGAAAAAELETHFVDLDGDGGTETITVHQVYGTFTDAPPYAKEGIVTVYDPDTEKAHTFSMAEHMGKVEFVSLNKDAAHQIVAWSQSGMHYTNLAVYGYKDDELYKIFETGSGCGIETDFQSNPPTIKIGVPKFDEEGWSYADEPAWEIYTWNGKTFVNE